MTVPTYVLQNISLITVQGWLIIRFLLSLGYEYAWYAHHKRWPETRIHTQHAIIRPLRWSPSSLSVHSDKLASILWQWSSHDGWRWTEKSIWIIFVYISQVIAIFNNVIPYFLQNLQAYSCSSCSVLYITVGYRPNLSLGSKKIYYYYRGFLPK